MSDSKDETYSPKNIDKFWRGLNENKLKQVRNLFKSWMAENSYEDIKRQNLNQGLKQSRNEP